MCVYVCTFACVLPQVKEYWRAFQWIQLQEVLLSLHFPTPSFSPSPFPGALVLLFWVLSAFPGRSGFCSLINITCTWFKRAAATSPHLYDFVIFVPTILWLVAFSGLRSNSLSLRRKKKKVFFLMMSGCWVCWTQVRCLSPYTQGASHWPRRDSVETRP